MLGVLEALEKVGLDDKQKAEIKKILGAAKAKAEKADKPREKFKIMREAHKKIVTDVLTDKQREKFEELMKKTAARRWRGRQLAGLDLTEEQEKKIREIMQEARKKAAEADKDKRREIMQAAMKKIHDEVLTDEQRKKAEQRREELRKNRRQRGRGRMKGPGGDKGEGDGEN